MDQGHESWGFALLISVALLVTLQALAVALTERLLLGLLLTPLLSVWALQRMAGWHGFVHFKGLLSMLLMGHIGMLLGATLDFGVAGLAMLAGWCSTLSGAGLGDLWFKLGIAPWSHACMFLGCNLGMLLSGCLNGPALRRGLPIWLFLSLSNLGMLLGLFAVEGWQPVSSGSLQVLALMMVAQMLTAMTLGMLVAWWLAPRLHQFIPNRHGPLTKNGADS
jgi:hypothetical protein